MTYPRRERATQGGTSIFTVLFLIFLVLKLTGTIAWSWWWVTAPLWGPALLAIAVIILILLIGWVAG